MRIPAIQVEHQRWAQGLTFTLSKDGLSTGRRGWFLTVEHEPSGVRIHGEVTGYRYDLRACALAATVWRKVAENLGAQVSTKPKVVYRD